MPEKPPAPEKRDPDGGICRESPDKKHHYGYYNAATRDVGPNVCRFCGRVSSYQPNVEGRLLQRDRVNITAGRTFLFWALLVLSILLVALTAAPIGLFMARRDDELNYATITGTSVASGAIQEDTLDLTQFGVNFADSKLMRIHSVHFETDAANAWTGVPAAGASQYSIATVTTITYGTTTAVQITNDGLIAWEKRLISVHATNGGTVQYLHRWGPEGTPGYVVATDNLYQQYNNTSGSTQRMRAIIAFTLQPASGDIFRELWEQYRRA